MNTGFGVLAESQIAGSKVELVGDRDPVEAEVENIGFLALGGDTKVKVLEGYTLDNLPQSSASLLNIANKRGLYVAAGPSSFAIGSTAGLREACRTGAEYKPELSVPSPINISHVVFNSDESYLILGGTQGGLAMYSIEALSGSGETKATFEVGTDGQGLREVKPNPVAPNLIAIITFNGELRMLDLETREFIKRSDGTVVLKPGVGTMTWSKLGKQLVCGMSDGTGWQMTPTGEVKCMLPAPPTVDNHFMSTIVWLENTLFLTVHTPVPSDSDNSKDSVFHMLERERDSVSFTYSKLADPAPPYGMEGRNPPYYFHVQLRDYEPSLSDLLIFSGTCAIDIGLVGRFMTTAGKDRNIEANKFTTIIPTEDFRRASMPLGNSMTDTSPIGMALDLSSKDNVKCPVGGEEIEQSPGPLPILMILNHEGNLKAWNVIYNDAMEAGKKYPGMAMYSSEQLKQAQPTLQTTQPSANSSVGTSSTWASPATSAPAAPAFGKPTFGTSPALGSGASPFAPPKLTGSLFGGAPSAQANNTPSFGTSSFGTAPPAKSAFGEATALGGGSATPFEKPAFGAPATLSSPVAFGRPSFGATSSLGGGSAPPAFGEASKLGGVAFGKTSAFGTPATAVPNASAFSSGNTSSGFGAYANKGGFAAAAATSGAQQGGSVFGAGGAFGGNSGQSPFAPRSNITSSPFTPKADSGTSPSPFAPRPESSSSPFAPRPESGASPFSENPFNNESPFTSKSTSGESPFSSKIGASPFSSVQAGTAVSPFASKAPSASASPFGSGAKFGSNPADNPFGPSTGSSAPSHLGPKSPFAQTSISPFGSPGAFGSKQAESSFHGRANPFETPNKPAAANPFGASFARGLDSPTTSVTPQVLGLPSSPSSTPPESPASEEEAPLPPDFSSLSVGPNTAAVENAPTDAPLPLPSDFSSLSVQNEPEPGLPPVPTPNVENEGEDGDNEDDEVDVIEKESEDDEPEPESESDADNEGENVEDSLPKQTPAPSFSYNPKPKQTTPSNKSGSNIFGQSTTFSNTIGPDGVSKSSPFSSFFNKVPAEDSDDDDDEEDEDDDELEVVSSRNTRPPPKSKQHQQPRKSSMLDRTKMGSRSANTHLPSIKHGSHQSFIKQEEKANPLSVPAVGTLFGKPSNALEAPISFEAPLRGIKQEEKKSESLFNQSNSTSSAPISFKAPLAGKTSGSLFSNSKAEPARIGMFSPTATPSSGRPSILNKSLQPEPEEKLSPSAGRRTPIPPTSVEDDRKSVVDFDKEYDDYEDEKIREQLMKGDVKPIGFLPPIRKMVDVEVPSDFNEVFDSIYQSGNIMVNNLGMVARDFKAYHLGQKVPAEGVKHEAPKDMQPTDDWHLCEMGLISKVADELLVKAKQIGDEKPELEEKRQMASKGFIKLGTKRSEIYRLLAVHNDPAAAARARQRLLAPEQQLQQRKLRKSFARVEKQLKETEHHATVLKAKIAQRDRHNAQAKVQPPTAEAVRNTIMKLTSMAEKKRNEVDFLEERLRRLRLKSNSRSLSATPGRFDTPSRFISPGRFATPERDATRTSSTPERRVGYGLVAPTPVMAVMEEGDVEEARDEHRRRRAIGKKLRGALERRGTTSGATLGHPS